MSIVDAFSGYAVKLRRIRRCVGLQLTQIAQDSQRIAEEEQQYRRLLTELEDEEHEVINYVGRYVDIER